MFETLDRLLKRLGVRRGSEHGATPLAQGWPATLLDHMLSDQRQSQARSKIYEDPHPTTMIDVDMGPIE
jgi:hypothetical protein